MRRVRYLPEALIENSTLVLLASYGRRYGEVVRPPVPVEEILEAHLELDLRFDNLPELLGVPDVLGATWVHEREVRIDESLDPTVDPTMEGRYRFTVSHEVGHWELHRSLYGDPRQAALFGEKPKPIVCRSGAKDPIEWQADCFAGYLLMPTRMVLAAWKAIYGKLEPYIAVDEIADLGAKWGLGPDERPTVRVAKVMAREFKVSGQAMQIRLVRLGFILTRAPERGLFAS
jgi:hypothetical protein